MSGSIAGKKKSPATSTISERLDSYRLEHDLTYPELGSLCGISHDTARRVCRGIASLCDRNVVKIERFLASVNV